MKKEFKPKKKRKKRILLFLLLALGIGVFINQTLEKSKIEMKDQELVSFITNNTYPNKRETFLKQVVQSTLSKNHLEILQETYQEEMNIPLKKEENLPQIYLYNSHQTEEYAASNFAEYMVVPTVQMNNYILEDILEKNGYGVIVETASIKDILANNGWNYSGSYLASRTLLENAIITHPSLTYFIDIHRDSLEKRRTTVTIDEKDYATILFIVGLENPNYEENLHFTETIEKKIQENYPGLSKGIYKKSGPGVNGVYNQDFSPHTILVEIGGYQNTTSEVLNTSIAFAKCFLEVLHE